MKKNLVLTGMMGVGKSTIGEKLASKLKLKFIDVDKYIEKKEKNTIKEIFALKGEDYFRDIEKKITLEMLQAKNLVLALGGGAFMNKSIRKEVIKTSISFWLDLRVQTLLRRLKNIKKRPLLNQNKLEESVSKIYSERKKIYSLARYRINCELLQKDQVINKIIKLYESSRNKI